MLFLYSFIMLEIHEEALVLGETLHVFPLPCKEIP